MLAGELAYLGETHAHAASVHTAACMCMVLVINRAAQMERLLLDTVIGAMLKPSAQLYHMHCMISINARTCRIAWAGCGKASG
jgi:hypothetical protein